VTPIEFYESVARVTGLSTEDAERVTKSTLLALADRLPGDETDEVAAQLPWPMKDWLTGRARSQPAEFGADELIQRVEERTGLPHDRADAAVRAVMSTLRATIAGEFDDMLAQLPAEFARLAA
jgi:uncharacterized protein (DUF2267 family)